jgi:N-acetylmuramoyl-L-alanine amidase
MRKLGRDKASVSVIVFAMVFCLTARPTLNAADPDTSASRGPLSLVEQLRKHADSLNRALHNRPLEQRGPGDYRQALDAYGQVIRLNRDAFFSAEALLRMAELEREMADASGDSAMYQKAIETLRKVIVEHPQSSFVGDSLIDIAQIYEENLQDLDGAASAYRELIEHFPRSVMAREARAVLARFEAQLRNRPVDVLIASDRGAALPPYEEGPRAFVTNVRNFTGPDYARVVIDLSGEAEFAERRSGGNRVSLQLSGAAVSPALYGRRFIVGESSLLKRIVISGPSAGGATVEIEVGSLSDYSLFRLPDPNRIVVDLHAAGALAKGRSRRSIEAGPETPAGDETTDAGEVRAARPEADPEAGGAVAKAKRSQPGNQNALLSLPEIPDPIVGHNPADAQKPGGGAAATAEAIAAKIDAKAAESPIKRIVIDPGHGGHDTGTISSNGLREKDLVLDVARRLRAYIKRNYADIEVILTRDSDRFVALEERTAIANSRRADLFISVHANASESRAASGVETYFLSPDRAPSENMEAAARENARAGGNSTLEKAQPIVASVRVGNRVAESRELARYIQAGLVRGIGAASPRTAANRGVKHAPFVVLLGAAMPSVLAEVSFMSNPRDEALLQTSQFRERIAASLFGGLNAYLKKNRPKPADAPPKQQ